MSDHKPESVVLLALNGDKVLAVSRKDNHKDFGLVGGKVEDNETHIQALHREVKEETGLNIHNVSHVYSNIENGYPVSVYRADISGNIHTNEPHVISLVPWSEVLKGSFGNFNKKLYKHIQDHPHLLNAPDEVIELKEASYWKKNRKAVVIKGNPKYINSDKNKELANDFYNKIGNHLNDRGFDVVFDDGEPYTSPQEADLWVGHSRGVDRLRFADKGTILVGLGTNQGIPGMHMYMHPKDTGGDSPFHYLFNDEAKEVIDNAIGFKKEASERNKKDMVLWHTWNEDRTNENMLNMLRQLKPLITTEVNKWAPSGVDLAGLNIDAHNFAIDAIKTFNPNKGVQLNTHVTNNLKKISRVVIENQNVIRVPEDQIYKYRSQLKDKEKDILDNKNYNVGAMTEGQVINGFQPITEHYYSKSTESNGVPIMHELTLDSVAANLFYKDLDSKSKVIFDTYYRNNELKAKAKGKLIASQLNISTAAVSKRKKKLDKNLSEFVRNFN